MIDNRFLRTEMLYGTDAVKSLTDKSVIIFGIGGVGGYVAESLSRAGIGNICIVDKDIVDITNINRQIYALDSTVGQNKVDVAKKRILDINPNCNVSAIKEFFSAENSNDFDFSKYDYIIDAIDTVTSKIELILCAKRNNIPIISSMGTGNKSDPTKFEVSDIYKTSVDPLARVLRYELKKRNVDCLKVVYSKEEPMKHENDKRIPASNSFVPPVAGFVIAGEVIKDLMRL